MVDVIRLGGMPPGTIRLGTPILPEAPAPVAVSPIETIRLETRKQRIRRQQREQRQRIITDPVGELKALAKGVGIAGTIAAIPFAAIQAPVAAALGIPLLAGLAATEPGREFIAAGVDPTRRFEAGKKLGAFIGLTPEEKEAGVTDILKSVGIGAGLTGAALAAVAVAPTIVKKVKERAAKVKLPVLPAVVAAPAALLQAAPVPTPTLEDIPGEIKPEPVEKEVVAAPAMPDINIKNVLKPEINVRVSQTRKFINQQLLIR